MLVTFICKNFYNITMFGDDAQRLLKIMGHNGKIPGVILAQDVPQFLQQLKDGIKDNKKKSTHSAPLNCVDNSDDRIIELSHRALPLIELFNTAVKEKCDVIWKAGDNIV